MVTTMVTMIVAWWSRLWRFVRRGSSRFWFRLFHAGPMRAYLLAMPVETRLRLIMSIADAALNRNEDIDQAVGAVTEINLSFLDSGEKRRMLMVAANAALDQLEARDRIVVH